MTVHSSPIYRIDECLCVLIMGEGAKRTKLPLKYETHARPEVQALLLWWLGRSMDDGEVDPLNIHPLMLSVAFGLQLAKIYLKLFRQRHNTIAWSIHQLLCNWVL